LTSPEPDKDRLKSLDARLRAARGGKGQDSPRGDGHLSQAQAGWRMVTELVAGIGIGFAMGWGLDSLAGTAPLFIVTMTLLGFAAGIKERREASRGGKDGPDKGDQGAAHGG